VSMVGVILVVGLLITPAATAYLLSDRLDRMMILSSIFGVTSVIGGLYLCIWLDSSGGGAIMLFCTFQFLVVLVVAPKYGLLSKWMRLRRMVPQQLVEDILGSVVRLGKRPATISDLGGFPETGKEELSSAIKSMIRDGLLVSHGNGFVLSQKGEKEAKRVLRAHRLWESYLKHVGMAPNEVHMRAHQLEHLRDTESVAYLDDLLGHPTHDPHGSEIPENAVECVVGAICPISALREGRAAAIVSLGKQGESIDIKFGESVIVGPRKLGGTLWSIRRQDGSEILLDHKTADSVLAKIME
jgi:Mn-dependent DtxR family transcriptional regulator